MEQEARAKPLSQAQFERAVQKYNPTLLTYGRIWNGKRFEQRELFVHLPDRSCRYKQGPDAFVEMLKELEALNVNTKPTP